MRVVVLPSWYPSHLDDSGGVFFREQALALARAGVQTDVISPRRISLRHILRAREPLTRLPGLIETRGSYVGLPRMAATDELRWRSVAKRLYSDYLRRHGPPDVLHAHSLCPAGMLAAELPARARVLTEHLSTFLGPSGPMLASRASAALRQFAARIAVGPDLAVAMRRMAPDSGDWITVPNLVDTSYFSPTQPPTRPVRVVTVSNLTALKRLDWVMRAFDLAFGVSDAELRIIGAGEERSRLEKLASRLRSAPRIHFLGELPRSKVRDELDRSTIFALASERETFGVVLLEAMAMGRPVLATNCGGPASIVNDQVGALVDVDDFPGFVEGLRRVASQLESYSPAHIRNYCISRFSEETVTARLIAIYTEALRSDRPAA